MPITPVPMIYDSHRGENEITADVVWADWHSLHNTMFSNIHNKIRERRKMYRLDWVPDDAMVAKRWRDYVIDPLPRNDVDFKADRLTMRPISIRVPTEQLDIDTVEVLNQNNGFQGVSPNTDLMQLVGSLRETARKMAQKRSDSIEKFLNGTLYINQLLRKENLAQRWAMHMLVDAYAGYMAYYDETATDDEYPIVLRVVDPLQCVYTRGDQKLEKFIVGNQDTVFNLRRQFGTAMFHGRSDFDIIYVIDYWRRQKVKTVDDLTGEDKWKPEVWHCTYLGASGISGDPYITGSGPVSKTNAFPAMGSPPPDMVGWALEPTKTDYFEIPGDMVEARTTMDTEHPWEMVSGDLDSAKEIWEGRNYFLTRMHKLSRLGSGADLVTKGIQGDVLQHLGKGEGATVSLPTDSPITPADAAIWTRPPVSDPNMQMHDMALNQMLQQSLIPITSLGNRGGTVSGAQVNDLDQGAAVRLQTFVNSMNLLHTSWARSVMQIAQVFYTDPNKKIPVYGIDRNSNPFALSISAADISGDFTVFVDVNPQTDMELLQLALTAINLTNPNPTQAILSKQTIRESYLRVPYNYQEEQRILREAEEFNENNIKVAAYQNLSQVYMQILANLDQMRVQAILTGAPVNPLITQLMAAIQQQLLTGAPADISGNEGGPQDPFQAVSQMLPTNEGAAQMINRNMMGMNGGPGDTRTQPPTNNGQRSAQQNAQAARNGIILPGGNR